MLARVRRVCCRSTYASSAAERRPRITLALAAVAVSSERTGAVVPGANGKIAFDSERDGIARST